MFTSALYALCIISGCWVDALLYLWLWGSISQSSTSDPAQSGLKGEKCSYWHFTKKQKRKNWAVRYCRTVHFFQKISSNYEIQFTLKIGSRFKRRQFFSKCPVKVTKLLMNFSHSNWHGHIRHQWHGASPACLRHPRASHSQPQGSDAQLIIVKLKSNGTTTHHPPTPNSNSSHSR